MKPYFNLGHRFPVLKSIESYFDPEYDVIYNFDTIEVKVKVEILQKIDQYPVWVIYVKDQAVCYYGKAKIVTNSGVNQMVEFSPTGKANFIDGDFDEKIELSFVTLDEERQKL